MLATRHPALVVIGVIIFFAAGIPRAAADDYSGQAVHRRPALRQFWRSLEEELEEDITELEPEWFHKKHLGGDWLGQRSTLADWGITPTLTYTGNVLGNPVGGKRQGIAYDHNIGVDINVDLEQLAGREGLVFHVAAAWRHGKNLSSRAIDNTFIVSNLFGGETLQLYDLSLEKSLLAGKLSVLLGRIGAGDEFLTSPLYSIFVNNAINGNPISVPINIPAFTSYPIAQWGFRAAVRPVPDWYVMTGIYNGDRTADRRSTHGADFSFRHKADIFTISEIGYLADQREDSPGLPGNYKFGGYYDAGPFPDLTRDDPDGARIKLGRPSHPRHENYGFYILADQQVYREVDAQDNQGLTLFAGATFAPQDSNTFPFFFMSGGVYHGPLPGRERDTAGFGVAYGQFSDGLNIVQRNKRHFHGTAIDGEDFEILTELTYQFELAPHFIVQPGIYYIIQPKGVSEIDNALVLGLQFAVNL